MLSTEAAKELSESLFWVSIVCALAITPKAASIADDITANIAFFIGLPSFLFIFRLRRSLLSPGRETCLCFLTPFFSSVEKRAPSNPYRPMSFKSEHA
jgi:hypothetical protein